MMTQYGRNVPVSPGVMGQFHLTLLVGQQKNPFALIIGRWIHPSLCRNPQTEKAGNRSSGWDILRLLEVCGNAVGLPLNLNCAVNRAAVIRFPAIIRGADAALPDFSIQ